MYDQLFTVERPDDGELESIINPKSLEVLENAYVEPALADAKVGDNIQFERTGYFCLDPDSTPSKPVFNLTVNLKDTWAKMEKKGK
jgi:glutaminyl-tRNA synthetase